MSVAEVKHRIETLMASSDTSPWMKAALSSALTRDAKDAANDALELGVLLTWRTYEMATETR